ncbi:conserved hypothetical protein [Candidatus Propionivibrio aalborgensis]|uniref:Glycosyl transferase n=1 Tax=Candidatus Propionivibrio aalborgensis TaxID=1860101 RepID=A0A1A8XWJ4_9RHOO|nr:hypothetical protein [Candidatus Propionivibrio aalborgensis]SBT09365.1 conserved hypothetical protein [Candidatus Propionivibrio aalborgensis]
MIVYTTLFDSGYLDRAIALTRSFASHNADDVLLLGCMDAASAAALAKMDLPGAKVLGPDSFIFGELLALKDGRNVAEFCWTTKPFLLSHVLDAYPDAEWAVYLDADSLVFGRISPALMGRNGFDCVFTPHNFAPTFAEFEATAGRYNAGFAAFRNSKAGRAALVTWRGLCAGAVSSRPTEGAYGDQKYLEQLVEQFHVAPGVVHKGLNVAPWNVGRYCFTQKGTQVLVDGEELLFFHFQGFQPITCRLSLMYRGAYPLPEAVKKLVYRPYLAALGQARRMAGQHGVQHLLKFPGFRKSLRALWGGRRNIALILRD